MVPVLVCVCVCLMDTVLICVLIYGHSVFVFIYPVDSVLVCESDICIQCWGLFLPYGSSVAVYV